MTSTADPAPPVFAGVPGPTRAPSRRASPMVCGIVNVTPDSFYDGGRYQDPARAVDHGHTLVAEGAEMLDVGGESTRPGSHPPSVAEEIARVVPVIDALARTTSVPISVDTSRPEVMREAVAAGAVMINDVRALRLRGALDAAAALKVPVCLMHMQGEPATMQIAPTYYDVVGEVHRFLVGRVESCLTAGVAREHIVLDPGFGFGKTLEHNLALLGRAAVHCQPRLSGDGWTVTQGDARSDHRSGGHRPTGGLSSGRSGRGPAGCLDLARPRCRRHRRRNSRHTGRRHRPSSSHEISTADVASKITDISDQLRCVVIPTSASSKKISERCSDTTRHACKRTPRLERVPAGRRRSWSAHAGSRRASDRCPRQGRPPAMREQEAAARTGMPAQDGTFESERIAGLQSRLKGIAPAACLVDSRPRHQISTALLTRPLTSGVATIVCSALRSGRIS